MQLASCRVASVGLVVMLTAAVTACGGEPDEPAAEPLAQIASGDDAVSAANGIDELSPDQVVSRAISSLEEAGTYHVSGTTTAGSTIDISFKVGKGSTGKVTTDSEVKLVAADDVVYLTSDAETLADEVGADIANTIADKWLLLPEESGSGFRIFARGEDFARAVIGSEVTGELTSVQDVGGQPAVGLVLEESGGTLWVAASGDPLPLRFEEKGASGESGVLKFSGFGEDVKISVPDEDDVVDPSTLPSDEDADGSEDGDE